MPLEIPNTGFRPKSEIQQGTPVPPEVVQKLSRALNHTHACPKKWKDGGQYQSVVMIEGIPVRKVGMRHPLPICPSYRKAVFEAVGLQLLIGMLSLLILDGGTTARICGISLVAFWGGVALMISRRPHAPTQTDIEWIRFGYLPLVVAAFLLVHFIWTRRGVE